jgi:hypothetical protein
MGDGGGFGGVTLPGPAAALWVSSTPYHGATVASTAPHEHRRWRRKAAARV